MNKYGADTYQTHQFSLAINEVESKNQWINVYLEMFMEKGSLLPVGLEDPSLLVICSYSGDIIQIVLLDEGCDSEFQLTPLEKEYIVNYVEANWTTIDRRK